MHTLLIYFIWTLFRCSWYDQMIEIISLFGFHGWMTKDSLVMINSLTVAYIFFNKKKITKGQNTYEQGLNANEPFFWK